MKYTHSKNIAWNLLGNNVIAFSLTGDRQFHELNETAAFIFQSLETPKSEEEILDAVLSEFDVPEMDAKADVHGILAEMSEKSLIEAIER